MGLFDKGVQKTKQSFFQKLSRAIVGKSKVDDDVLDAIEEALVSSDMGVDTTLKIIDSLESRVKSDKYMSLDELADMLRDEIGELLNVGGEISSAEPFDLTKKPLVVMVVISPRLFSLKYPIGRYLKCSAISILFPAHSRYPALHCSIVDLPRRKDSKITETKRIKNPARILLPVRVSDRNPSSTR